MSISLIAIAIYIAVISMTLMMFHLMKDKNLTEFEYYNDESQEELANY
jgi:hypothetical protein